jgi:predicted unusual protein kinase regulating ubiquinone biosynthesis (AarF/ABC1/UbiB family)
VEARQLFSQLRAHVLAETDYHQEASAQGDFSRALRDDPDFVVPAVVAVTDRVLVSDWVDGTPVLEVSRSGTPSERDRVGALLARFLLSSPVRVGRLHGDPHPGNFRLLDDGRLAVVDFGSTLTMPQGWPSGLGRLLRAARDRDATSLHQIAVGSGLVTGADTTADDLLALLDPLMEPLREETFAFTRQWLRDQALRFSDPRSAAARTQRRLHVPVRYMLVQRVAAGTTGVLCQLGATVALRDEAGAWVPELS